MMTNADHRDYVRLVDRLEDEIMVELRSRARRSIERALRLPGSMDRQLVYKIDKNGDHIVVQNIDFIDR